MLILNFNLTYFVFKLSQCIYYLQHGTDERMETDGGEVHGIGSSEVHSVQQPTTVRKGPGYSVINPEHAAVYNMPAERLMLLASQLELQALPKENLVRS